MNNAQDIFNFVNGSQERRDVSVFRNEELDLYMRTILNEDGSISVNAEDTARGFGWTTVAKSGNEVVRWARINEYCKEIGFPNKLGKDDYIPESLFYLLAMKASNERAQKFQKWLAIDVVPAIRKTGNYETSQYKQQAKQRDLTKDDYIRAASIISGCRNERLPYVMAFLEQAGLEMPEVEQVQKIQKTVSEIDDGTYEEYTEKLKVAAWERKGRSMLTCRQFNDFCSEHGISASKYKRWLYQNGYIMASEHHGDGKINYSLTVWKDGRNKTERCIVFKKI